MPLPQVVITGGALGFLVPRRPAAPAALPLRPCARVQFVTTAGGWPAVPKCACVVGGVGEGGAQLDSLCPSLDPQAVKILTATNDYATGVYVKQWMDVIATVGWDM